MSESIPFGIYPKDEQVTCGDAKLTYMQEADACSSDLQELKIFTEDGGGGPYFVFETTRWAFNEIEELTRIFEDFKNRFPFPED